PPNTQNQKSCRKSRWCRRKISRKRRRTRLRATALPRRREVMKPTRDRPEFSTATVLSISSLPRPTRPSRFTRSYSDVRVRRRCFGNESELTRFIWVVDSLPYAEECWRAELCDANPGLAEFAPPNTDAHLYSKSLLPGDFGRRLREKRKPGFTG